MHQDAYDNAEPAGQVGMDMLAHLLEMEEEVGV